MLAYTADSLFQSASPQCRLHPKRQQGGHDHFAVGTECTDGTLDCQAGLRTGDGPGDVIRHGGQFADERRDEGTLPWRPQLYQGSTSTPTGRTGARLNGTAGGLFQITDQPYGKGGGKG